MHSARRFGLVAPLLAIIAACGSSDESTPMRGPGRLEPELHYELLPWTKELTAETLARTKVGDDDGSVRFQGAPSQLVGLKKGDVLLAGQSATTPRGLLRLVLEVRDEGGEMIVTTAPAPIQAAFRTLHARLPAGTVALDGAPADPFGTKPQTKYAVGKSVGGGKSLDWRVFDQDGDRSTKDDQLYVTGQITGKVALTAYVDLDWLDEPARIAEEIACLSTVGVVCKPSLPDVMLGVRAEALAEVSIDAEGAASKRFESDEIPIDGTNVDLPPLVAGPVVIYPSIDFVAQVSGSATSRFHAAAGIKYSAVAEASVGLTSGGAFTPPTFTREIVPPTVEATLSSEVKASVGPRIKLMFWDTFGPSVSALGYAKLRADREKQPCFAVDAGAELGVSLSLKVPWKLFGGGPEALGDALGLSGDIYKKRFGPYELFSVPDVLTGACSALPSNVYPPGEGPSEEAYKAPTFAPWSRRFADDSTRLYQYPYSFEAPQTVIHAEKSIDGGWFASGRGIYGLFKIGEGGDLRWSKNVKIAPLDDREYETERPSTFATQARNTSVWVASSRFSLMQLDQDGDLLWARRFVPRAPAGDPAGDALFSLGSALDAVSVVETIDGGLFVLYSLQKTSSDGPAILVRVDARGDLLWAKQIAFETKKTMLGVMALDGDDVLLAGQSWVAGAEVARVLRVRGDGTLAFAKRLGVCGSERVRPVQLVRLASGAYALLGGYGLAPERSFILQMPADASAASLFAWDTNDALSDLRASQIAQLPTTGFVTASQIVPTVGTSIRLAAHDAQGTLVRERELTLTTGGTRRETFPGAIRLTNDGGLLMFAHSEESTFAPPALWVSKIPARTLEADFSGTSVTVGTPVSSPRPSCQATFSPEEGFALTALSLETIDITDKVTVTSVAARPEVLLPKP